MSLRGRSFGPLTRILLPLAAIVAVSVLFSMVWQSVGEQSEFAASERDGIRYIQALVPLEIALTNAESAALSGNASPRDQLGSAIAAVAAVDGELRDRLRTQDRWAELRTKIESLPTEGGSASLITAYGGAHDLLLALMDKVRNTSKLIRDPEADTYYLEDGAAQELPEGIVAAARYTSLLVSVAGLSKDEQAKSLVDLNSARSDLTSNVKDLSDDIRLAVEDTGTVGLGAALLSKLDRFNRSIDTLVPMMSPLLAGKGAIDPVRVVKARDEMQAAAADLSAAILGQIDIALGDRVSSLDRRRVLALGALAVAVLLALAPAASSLLARRRAATEPAPPSEPPVSPPPGRPEASQPPPRQPEMAASALWPAPSETPHPEYAQWERYGAPR